MSPELEKQLYEKYPEIFEQRTWKDTESAMSFGFEHGDGWYNIVDVLCSQLTVTLRTRRRHLEWLQKVGVGNPKWGGSETVTDYEIEEAKRKVREALDVIPRATQVKEKYGTLRFYVDQANAEEYAAIDFAEMMSARTCEVCGNVGKPRGNAWIRTLCDDHAKTN